MIKKFNVPCIFGGQRQPIDLYIGDPETNHHPLHFQNDWLGKERNGQIPGEVMDSIAKLQQLAYQNNISFEELCFYAINTASGDFGNIDADTAMREIENMEE